MTDHTPPEGAIEAGCRAWQDDWDALESHVQDACRVVVVDMLTAAHEAGEIVWREEHEVARGYVKDAARALVRSPALADEKARADEAVALLRTSLHWLSAIPEHDGFPVDTLDPANTEVLKRHRGEIGAFLATQEDRA